MVAKAVVGQDKEVISRQLLKLKRFIAPEARSARTFEFRLSRGLIHSLDQDPLLDGG
jgi:hypothetical protein